MNTKEFKKWYEYELNKDNKVPNLEVIEAFIVLTKHLLGEDFMIIDPVGGEQAVTLIVKEIIEIYPKKNKEEIR